MLKKKIKQYIAPIRRKIVFERVIDTIIIAFAILSMLFVFFAIATHIFVILYAQKWMLGAATIAGLLGLLIGLLQYPKLQEVLKATDQLGYKERFITAWALIDSDTVEARLQREDTLEIMTGKDLRKSYKIKWKPKRLLIGLGLMIISIFILLIPSQKREVAKETETVINDILEQEKILSEKAEEIFKDKDDLKAFKEAQEEVVEELEERLKEAMSEEDALKALSMAKNELSELDMADLQEAMEKMESQMNALNNQTDDQKASDAMKDEMNALAEALEALKEKDLTAQESEVLEDALEKLDEALENNDQEAIEEALEEMNQAMANMEALASAASSMSNSLQEAANEAGAALSTSPTVSELAFNSTSSSASATQSSTSGEGQSGEGQSGQGQSGQGQEGQSQGESEGEGQSSGQGQEQGGGQGGEGQGSQGGGQGQGQASQSQGEGQGQGQGAGSTNEDGGYSSEGSALSQSWFEGQERSENYEALYAPERLGGSSEPSFVQGNRGDSGQTDVQEVEGAPTMTGEMINYKELYAQYSDEAMHSVESMEIPVLMKDLVKAYFDSLE